MFFLPLELYSFSSYYNQKNYSPFSPVYFINVKVVNFNFSKLWMILSLYFGNLGRLFYRKSWGGQRREGRGQGLPGNHQVRLLIKLLGILLHCVIVYVKFLFISCVFGWGISAYFLNVMSTWFNSRSFPDHFDESKLFKGDPKVAEKLKVPGCSNES